MGGIVSRISPDITFNHGLNESFNRLKNNFDGTPKYKMIDDKMIDPRSPTLEINRTPLCLLDIADEEGNTPVARNRKKSKRRSSRNFEVESTGSNVTSRSFEFTSLTEGQDSKILPWEPRVESCSSSLLHEEDKSKDTKTSDDKYDVVVEELRECLSKVTVAPVFIDEDLLDKKFKVDTTPVTKDTRKKFLCTPDHNLTLKSPVTRERTPLGLVSNNLAGRRLNNWQGGKIWRGPADERAKLQGENTPPLSLPPFGSPKSAPPTNRHLHFSLK